jgi:hypothetical protein
MPAYYGTKNTVTQEKCESGVTIGDMSMQDHNIPPNYAKWK